MPALAKHMAMPPPIVPAPTTAAFLISRTGVSSGTPGILVVWRSAKNRWRSAFDSVLLTRCAKRSRSSLRPSSKGRVSAAPRGHGRRAGGLGAGHYRERRRRALRLPRYLLAHLGEEGLRIAVHL